MPLDYMALLDDQYVWEWGTTLVMLLVALPFEGLIEPRHRLFRLDNPAIQFPMVMHEHVPSWLLVLLVFIIPGGIIASASVSSNRLRKSMPVSLLAFSFAIALNMLVTNGLKFMIGNPRPDFLSRCKPAAGTALDKYVDVSVCTNKAQHVMYEAFKSSPSGHSSSAFCGLGFLAFWLHGEAQLFGSVTTSYEALGLLSPFLLALFIAVSRIIDYRHHWYDVLCGSLLGLGAAYGSYRLYFKKASSSSSSSTSSLSSYV